MRRWWMMMALVTLVMGCVDEPADEAMKEAYTDHAEASDLEPVESLEGKSDSIRNSFNRHDVVDDAFFTNSDALSAAELQRFFERSPYGNRSWLADYSQNGRSAAELIVEAARAENINPIMLLVRMQVEASLVSPSSRPSNFKINRAMGCGCFDGQACMNTYLGFRRQLKCSAETHRKRFEDSRNTSGWPWRKGRSKRTLDGYSVTPQNHATAALYSYTPWVLIGRGGNWLVWNIAKKFVRHMATLGIDIDDGGAGGDAWIGTACASSDECSFSHRETPGFCYDFVDSGGQTRGFCSLPCEGLCPDRSGHATTFCIASDTEGTGICVSRAASQNNFCEAIPGTVKRDAQRFVGDSGQAVDTKTVCAPEP